VDCFPSKNPDFTSTDFYHGRGAWTVAPVKIQCSGARAFPLKKREKRKKTKVTEITCFSIKEKRKRRKRQRQRIMSGVVYVTCDTSLNAMGMIFRVYI
jgi:hypothetical protein